MRDIKGIAFYRLYEDEVTEKTCIQTFLCEQFMTLTLLNSCAHF